MEDLDLQFVEKLAEYVLRCYENKNEIFVFGNGGNSAFADNLVTDLNLHPFVGENKSENFKVSKRLRAHNLCNSSSTLTGILNDFGGDYIFSKQLEYLGKPNDLVIGFSGSGNSKNVLLAFEYAKQNNMTTVLITRKQDGKCNVFSDLAICINGNSNYPGQTGNNNNNFHFEDMISKISHMVTGILKQAVHDAN
jgi:D-sedoheptulose 7-phosphate isomerase